MKVLPIAPNEFEQVKAERQRQDWAPVYADLLEHRQRIFEDMPDKLDAALRAYFSRNNRPRYFRRKLEKNRWLVYLEG